MKHMVHFNKIAVNGNHTGQNQNKQFYATRSVRNDDRFISTINVSTSSGVFSDYFEFPGRITTLTKPPQLNAGRVLRFKLTLDFE